MVKKLEASTRLRVSEDCCLYYLEQQSTRMPVAEIAAAVGISARTFYRYFPVKADSVAPIFDHMTETMNSVVIAGPAPDLRQLMIDAFETMFTTRITSRAAEFFPLVFADPEIWALFLRKVQAGETSLSPLLAASLNLAADDNRARAAAAAVASSTRIALERLTTHGADPSVEFTGLLDAFGDQILRPSGQPAADTLNFPAGPPG